MTRNQCSIILQNQNDYVEPMSSYNKSYDHWLNGGKPFKKDDFHAKPIEPKAEEEDSDRIGE